MLHEDDFVEKKLAEVEDQPRKKSTKKHSSEVDVVHFEYRVAQTSVCVG